MARRSPWRTAAEVALLVLNDYVGHIDRPVDMYESDEELFDEGRWRRRFRWRGLGKCVKCA